MTEEWRPIAGWARYEVSDLGRVRSVYRLIRRSDGQTQGIPGRILSLDVDGTGRPTARLYDRGLKRVRVHKLVIEAFVGPRPDGMECCHNDGNPLNNRLENLRWDTRSSNLMDRIKHGTCPNASRTHCVHGHELSGDNVYLRVRNGRHWRQCRECNRQRNLQARRDAADIRARARRAA